MTVEEAEVPYGLWSAASFMPRSMSGITRVGGASRPTAPCSTAVRAGKRSARPSSQASASRIARFAEAGARRRSGGSSATSTSSWRRPRAQPPLPIGAFDGLSSWEIDKAMVAACPYAWPWNVLGWPGVNVPAGFTEAGLPIGAQLLGPANSESRLISLSVTIGGRAALVRAPARDFRPRRRERQRQGNRSGRVSRSSRGGRIKMSTATNFDPAGPRRRRAPKKRHIAIAIGCLAFLAIAGSASGLVLRAGDLIITADGGFTPKALPKHEDAPIKLHGGGKLSTASGELPPILDTLTIEFDRHGSVDTTGLPSARRGNSSPPLTATRKEALPGRRSSARAEAVRSSSSPNRDRSRSPRRSPSSTGRKRAATTR